MKTFHFKEKIDSLPKSVNKITSPIHIRIKPTNVCNHNCRYCAYRVGDLQLGKDMIGRDFIPEEKMMEVIDDIEEMGVKAVTFSGGGEPFCYPYLLAAVRKISKTAIKFAALTNGAKLTGEIAEIFAHYGSWIRISMDGWNEYSYSSYRRVPPGEFTKIMTNMSNFKELNGKCYLSVVIIVDRNNAAHIYNFINKLYDAKVNSVKIAPCIVSNDGRENNNYHRPIFEEVKEQINRAKEDLKESYFEIFDSYHGQLETFNKEYNWCPYLQILPVIGADQNVYSCQDKAYNLEDGLIGSIRENRFKDFWLTDKNKFFKINPAVHCKHHCVANPKNRFILEYLNADREHLGFV